MKEKVIGTSKDTIANISKVDLSAALMIGLDIPTVKDTDVTFESISVDLGIAKPGVYPLAATSDDLSKLSAKLVSAHRIVDGDNSSLVLELTDDVPADQVSVLFSHLDKMLGAGKQYSWVFPFGLKKNGESLHKIMSSTKLYIGTAGDFKELHISGAVSNLRFIDDKVFYLCDKSSTVRMFSVHDLLTENWDAARDVYNSKAGGEISILSKVCNGKIFINYVDGTTKVIDLAGNDVTSEYMFDMPNTAAVICTVAHDDMWATMTTAGDLQLCPVTVPGASAR